MNAQLHPIYSKGFVKAKHKNLTQHSLIFALHCAFMLHFLLFFALRTAFCVRFVDEGLVFGRVDFRTLFEAALRFFGVFFVREDVSSSTKDFTTRGTISAVNIFCKVDAISCFVRIVLLFKCKWLCSNKYF